MRHEQHILTVYYSVPTRTAMCWLDVVGVRELAYAEPEQGQLQNSHELQKPFAEMLTCTRPAKT
jgi:hypothetical protein